MPSLKDIIRAAHDGQNLIVTGPHSDWMERLEAEKAPSKKALIHAIKALMGGYKHERSGRFSPSAIGNPFVPCNRAVLFGYAGAPQLASDIEAAEMMDHGSIDHIKWQIEGLTLGYMTAAEVWAYDEALLTGGSVDGILEDDSIFELKTANVFAYNRIVIRDKEPKYETLIQLGIYMLLLDKDWGSIVYEDRGGGEFTEYRIARSTKIEEEVLRRLHVLKMYMEADDLPDMLDGCEQRIGQAYKMCGYRKVCPLLNSVSQAQQLGHDVATDEVLLAPEMGRVVPQETVPTWAEQLITYIESLPED